MDRRELEIMLNEAFDRGIVSVGHLVHETVEVGFLNELGRTVGFTLNGWKEAIETIPVDLFDSFDDGRGREWFLSDCKALGGKVPQNTYRGELVSALADVLMVEEAAPALGALESALDSARRKGYCVFDRGVHGDVPADGLVYLCSTYPAAVGLKDSLDSIRAQGNDPDTRTLGVYRISAAAIGSDMDHLFIGIGIHSSFDTRPRRALHAPTETRRIKMPPHRLESSERLPAHGVETAGTVHIRAKGRTCLG